MRIARTVAEVRAELVARTGTVGFVPTMGALHAGHIALIEHAAAHADEVVVSVFVNPTQFNESTDYTSYPRDEQRDERIARAAGATLLFAPDADELYPAGFATSVRVTGPLTETLEGAQRGPEHFHGVTTIVTKLLNIVAPDVCFFGQKDAQQALVIRRLVADLNIDTQIAVLPTVREDTGLALSSRNTRLTPEDRTRAVALIAALRAARDAAGATADPQDIRDAAISVLHEAGVDPEYFAIVDPDTLVPLDTVNGSGALLAVAARVGDVRLIDNLLVSPNPNTQKVT